MIVERREFPRQPLSEEVHCYIDGVRFDAHTIDVSAGGAFVRTKRSRAVSPGALVGLVFVRHPRVLHTTFLFGRVVRVQTEPAQGLALSWEKAVTVAPPEDLARFLETLFNIQNPVLFKEESGPRGQVRNVFSFSSISQRELTRPPWSGFSQRPQPSSAPGVEPAPEPSYEPLQALATPDAPVDVPGDAGDPVLELPDPFDATLMGTAGLTVTADDVAAIELKVIALEDDGIRSRKPAGGADVRHAHPEPGQISQMVARNDVPVSLPALLVLGDDTLSLTIRELGENGAFVKTAFSPVDRTATLSLRFYIPARRGPIPVNCRCSLKEVLEPDGDRGPGLYLRFTSTEDTEDPAVLARYIKFLQFHRLARS